MVVFGQSGGIFAKMVVIGMVVPIGQSGFIFGQSGCIRARWLYSG